MACSFRRKAPFSLPEELIEDILLRLPVKSLLRFRAVCKPWRSQISSASFAKLHMDRTLATSNSQYFIVHSKICSYKYQNCHEDNFISLHQLNSPEIRTNLNLPFSIPPDFRLSLAPSCNGIVCGVFVDPSNNQFIFLWNPATNQSYRLPQYNLPNEDNLVWFSLGFGFDPIDNDYKVVRVLIFAIESCLVRAEVYSANRDCWREIKTDIHFNTRPSTSDSCVASVKGMMYWDAIDELVMFDLNKEVFKKIPLPVSCDYERPNCSIVEHKDCVAQMQYNLNDADESEKVDVVLWSIINDVDEYLWAKEWTKKLTFEKCLSIERIFANLKAGGIILAETNKEDFLLYDSENEMVRLIPTPCGSFRSNVLVNYIETLVSIRGFKQVQ